MKTNGMMIRRTALATMFAAVFALAGCSNLLSKLGESDLSLSGGVMLPTASGGSRYAAAVDIDDDGTVDGLDLDGDRTTLELIILETGTDAAAGLYALDADNDGVADIYLRVNTKTLSTLNTEADGSGTPAVLVENATGDVAGVDTSGDGTTDIVVVAVNNVADTAITVSAIPGVTVPAYGDTPVTTITATAQYTGTVTWSPSPATFAASTDYTATITLTAKTGYTLTGVAADFFTVTGSTSDTNTADSGVVTAAFPATTSTLPATITTAAIPGVTAPVAGATPVTTITETAQYTGTVAWSDTPVTFAASTAYTATITLTAKSGYTLTGVAADFFTVTGSTSDTNTADSGVVTAVFPATAAVTKVYVGGFSTNASSISKAVYWVDGTLMVLDATESNGVKSIAVSGTDVYAAGSSVDAGVTIPGYWKNGTWLELSHLDADKGGFATSMILNGGVPYIAGISYDADWNDMPVYWSGAASTRTDLSPPASTLYSAADAIMVVGASVYVGGWSFLSTDYVRHPGYWKDGAWNPLTPLSTTNNSFVTSLASDGTNVYAGGYGSNGTLNVANVWNVTAATRLDYPLVTSGYSYYIRSIQVSDGIVYAGGSAYTYATTNIDYAGYWKGTEWRQFTVTSAYDSTKASDVLSIYVSGNTLYAAGYATKSTNVTYAGYWTCDIAANTYTWTELSPIVTTKDSKAFSIVLAP